MGLAIRADACRVRTHRPSMAPDRRLTQMAHGLTHIPLHPRRHPDPCMHLRASRADDYDFRQAMRTGGGVGALVRLLRNDCEPAVQVRLPCLHGRGPCARVARDPMALSLQ
jgi:hypothetical protein